MQPQGVRRVCRGRSSESVGAAFVTWGPSEKMAAAHRDTAGLPGNARLDSDRASRSSRLSRPLRGPSAPPPREREGLCTGPCPRKPLEECEVLRVGDTSPLSDPGSEHPGPSPAASGCSHCEWSDRLAGRSLAEGSDRCQGRRGDGPARPCPGPSEPGGVCC